MGLDRARAATCATFKIWAADLKSIGVTRVEISAPWNLLEPKPGEYDLSFITDRLAVCKSLGLGMRIRINSFYQRRDAGLVRAAIAGRTSTASRRVGTPLPPSITDERFWQHFGPLCTKIAAAVKGEDVYLNAFIGVHAELKFGRLVELRRRRRWRCGASDRGVGRRG